MIIQITEVQLQKIVEDTSKIEKVDAILIGGLDTRPGDYNINQQVQLLKRGLGSDKNVKGFRYNTPTSQISDIINKNPNIPVFMFSAGCRKAADLSTNPNVDLNKVFVIEPYGASKNVKQIIQSAVSNGIPPKNVFVGDNTYRGLGVVSGAVSSNSQSHWGALEKVASIKNDTLKTSTQLGLTFRNPNKKSQVTQPQIKQITTKKPTSSGSKPDNVKKFQSWLDKNHPGWHNKYGVLNDDPKRGWGMYGPNTTRAWTNLKIRNQYLNSKTTN